MVCVQDFEAPPVSPGLAAEDGMQSFFRMVDDIKNDMNKIREKQQALRVGNLTSLVVVVFSRCVSQGSGVHDMPEL